MTLQIKAIKVGCWYETNVGVGECVRSGGTFPPSVRIQITAPFPRGLVNVKPRDVFREVTAVEGVAR